MNVNWRFISCAWHRRRLRRLGMESDGGAPADGWRRHLERCAACRRYDAEIRVVLAAGTAWARRLPDVEPSPGLSARWERRIRESRSAPRAERQRMGWPVPIPGRGWSVLAAAWLVIGLLRWSAPGAGDGGAVSAPLSWNEFRTALGQGPSAQARAESGAPEEGLRNLRIPGGREGDRGEIRTPRTPRLA